MRMRDNLKPMSKIYNLKPTSKISKYQMKHKRDRGRRWCHRYFINRKVLVNNLLITYCI